MVKLSQCIIGGKVTNGNIYTHTSCTWSNPTETAKETWEEETHSYKHQNLQKVREHSDIYDLFYHPHSCEFWEQTVACSCQALEPRKIRH